MKSPIGNVAAVSLPALVSPNWWVPITSSKTYSDYNSEMGNMMYEHLIDISRTDGVVYSRSLASGVTWNSSGTVYTITLNKKWKWSNGTPVTSADVVWTMHLMVYLSGSSSPWQYGGAGIGGLPVRWKGVVADGSDKVIVTLAQPSNPQWFLHNGLGLVVPVPKATWDIHKSMVKEDNFLKNVANSPQDSYYSVVDGAFKYDAAASKPDNEYWTFVPNASYDLHKATISKVIYEYESSSASRFAALETDKINVGYLSPSLWDSKAKLKGDKLSATYLYWVLVYGAEFRP